jgi:hypothetical protein
MFQPTIVHPKTPTAVRAFVGQVMDLYFTDVHAMLRLPRPEVDISQACNFAIAAVLMNVISGISTVLYALPPSRKDTGRKFQQALRDFFPWDAEPAYGVRDPDQGGKIVYETLRNPMAHASGLQDPEPFGPVSITRFPPPGLSETDLEEIETSRERPHERLPGAPTLMTDPVTTGLSLNVEALYWGVRELLRRLTADAVRMAAAEIYLGPMLRVRGKRS